MAGEPHFFVFLDAADRMAIGAKLYYHAKVGSFRDSIRVLRESIRVSVFVWSFACLYAKFVVCDISEIIYSTFPMNYSNTWGV